MTGERIGVIAGSGEFPILFARSAARHDLTVIAVAHEGETDPGLAEHVDTITWVKPGQLQALIDALQAGGVTRAVMVGGIAKPRLFHHFEPDERALAAIARVGTLRDDLLLRMLADELATSGITIVESTLYLQDIVPQLGVLSARVPSPQEWEEIHFGLRAAKEIGRFDIGQSVVVRGGAVIAVEGIEGTDATIRRAGSLVNGGIVVVKACKPTQDTRFDLPAVGPETIRTMIEARGKVLAIEAGRTVMLERETMLALANDAGVCVVAVEHGEGSRA